VPHESSQDGWSTRIREPHVMGLETTPDGRRIAVDAAQRREFYHRPCRRYDSRWRATPYFRAAAPSCFGAAVQACKQFQRMGGGNGSEAGQRLCAGLRRNTVYGDRGLPLYETPRDARRGPVAYVNGAATCRGRRPARSANGSSRRHRSPIRQSPSPCLWNNNIVASSRAQTAR